jgi:hypothetical protein
VQRETVAGGNREQAREKRTYTLNEVVSIAVLCCVVVFAISQVSDSLDEGASIQLMAPFIALITILVFMVPLSLMKKPIAFLVAFVVYVIADVGTFITPGSPWVNGWRTYFNLTYLVYYAISSYALYINIKIYNILSKRQRKST